MSISVLSELGSVLYLHVSLNLQCTYVSIHNFYVT